MALNFLRLRRALSLSSSLRHHFIHQQKPISLLPPLFHLLSATTTSPTAFSQLTRPFTSTTALFLSNRRKPFDPETDEIGPDTILFEGCDYNHWLITVDFPKDSNLTREQMIEFYVNTAAQVFGSVEESKKKIYALSTTTYQGFQVECSEETSQKFQSLPGVVFVLPDSYIDPVNKEYGGDKYVNGEIFPRPPPVHYGRSNNRDRRPREQMPYQQRNAAYNNQGPLHSEARNYGQNYGPPQHENYGSPQQQNYSPPRQQNYGPQQQQNYGPLQQQNYSPPQQQNYGRPLQQGHAPPPQQGHAPPPQQGHVPPPQQGHVPPPQQGYAPPPQQGHVPPPQQGHLPPPQQGYAPLPQQQNYGQPPNFPPQQNYSSSGSGERRGPMPTSNASGVGGRNSMPHYQGNLSQGEFGNYSTQGQRDFRQGNIQSHVPPEHRGFSLDVNHGSVQDRSFGQGSGDTRDQATRTVDGQNQPKQGEDKRFSQMDERSNFQLEQRNFSSTGNY